MTSPQLYRRKNLSLLSSSYFRDTELSAACITIAHLRLLQPEFSPPMGYGPSDITVVSGRGLHLRRLLPGTCRSLTGQGSPVFDSSQDKDLTSKDSWDFGDKSPAMPLLPRTDLPSSPGACLHRDCSVLQGSGDFIVKSFTSQTYIDDIAGKFLKVQYIQQILIFLFPEMNSNFKCSDIYGDHQLFLTAEHPFPLLPITEFTILFFSLWYPFFFT